MAIITSKDGTQIAYDKTGQGPAVILVTGAMGTRAFGFAELVQLLAPHFTVYNYDRRGRGESTDTQPYAVDREIEDIQALVDAAGGSAYLYGLSSGACLVLEAAIKLGDKIKKIALYEAPYSSDPADEAAWRQYYASLHELIAADKRGDAIELFMKFLQVPEDMIAGMKTQPMWPALEAVAPTLVYDAQAMGGESRAVPVERAAQLTTPALLMDGEVTRAMYPFMQISADALAQAMPNATRRTLAGQGHDVDAKVIAPVLIDFFSNRSGRQRIRSQPLRTSALRTEYKHAKGHIGPI